MLIDIDDSYLQEQATNQKILRDKAEADKISAEQTYPVKFSAIGLAEQTLEKWNKGDYPQSLHDLEGQIQTADSNLSQEADRTDWVARMVKKGYMTASQEEAERALLMGNQLALQKVQEQRKVLLTYTDPVNRQTYENLIKQAKNDERTAYSAMLTAQAVFLQQDSQYRDLLDQIKQCKVYAQNTGIVVYSVPEQSQRGVGTNQSIIAQGEPVAYGQKMMSIPDLSHMLVNVRVHEAFINNMRDGLTVHVRVDAVPGKTLNAHVKSVANVAAQQDWMSPDVKVYQAYIEIEDAVQQLKLKPGLSAVSTIFTETKAENALAVPLPAIVRPQEKGAKPRVFVMTPHGPEAREVEIGINDEKYIEVTSGLTEGENVVLNPRALLSDKDKKGAQADDKIVPSGKSRPQGQVGRLSQWPGAGRPEVIAFSVAAGAVAERQIADRQADQKAATKPILRNRVDHGRRRSHPRRGEKLSTGRRHRARPARRDAGS